MPSRTRPHTIVRAGAGALALSLALTLPACGAFSRGEVDYARPFPADAQREQVLDIQVFREGTTITMTNATARSFGPSTLWVNRWFSRPIDGLEAGETIELDLYEFRDRYQNAFRAGGFFATQDPDPVVMVELEPGGEERDGTLYGFVVVRNEMN